MSYGIRVVTVVLLTLGLLLGIGGCASSSKSPSVEMRLQLGFIYLSRGDYNAAYQNFHRALQMAPDDYRTQLAMARFQQTQGNLSLARQHYDIARQKAPENVDVLNSYGVFLCRERQYGEAQKQFSHATRISDPGSVADSLENAGYCYLYAGDRTSARQILTQALQANRQKTHRLLREVKERLDRQEKDEAQFLLEICQQSGSNRPVNDDLNHCMVMK